MSNGADAETVVDVAKKETTRQTVILVFSLAGTVAMVYLMRSLSEPDVWKMWKMKGALQVKRYCQHRADWWQNQAEKAATVYNRERA